MLIMVLIDGQTFSGLDGCAIYSVPDHMDIEEIEELLANGGDDLAVVTRFTEDQPPQKEHNHDDPDYEGDPNYGDRLD